MRIALVAASFLPKVGGAEFVVHRLGQAWSALGHEVCVFNWLTERASHPGGRYAVRRYRTLRGDTRFGYHRPPWVWVASRSLGRALDAYAPDFVSAHYGYPTATYLRRGGWQGRFVVTCHGAELTPFPWGFRAQYQIDRELARSLNASRHVVALTGDARGWIESLGVARERVVEIPNGVEYARFHARAAGDFRATMGLPSRAVVLLGVGRHQPTKRFEDAVAAFARVARESPDAFLVLAGPGMVALREATERHGVSERVVLSEGLYDDALVRAYQQSDALVLPSVFEVFPLVVLEAMAAGLPAIVTRVSGSRELVLNGENGFVVEARDIVALADAMRAVVNDRVLRAEMGARNREKARAYDWIEVAGRYLALRG